MPLSSGTSLGRYTVLSHLGAGGMGEVYLTEDAKLRRRLALKILPTEFSQDDQRVARFVREARAASALNHPNICTIYEINDECNPPFIAMEYVEGETLDVKIIGGNLDLPETLNFALQISEALAEAHAADIVHRDIKPQNIIINRRGQAKILDFGLAKRIAGSGTDAETETQQLLSSAGMIMGTVRYMSPEQARGQEVDARTDIFSFGVVLYEMLCGQRPFTGETTSDIIAAILTREITPPSIFNSQIPAELERIVGKSLAKDRDERYQAAKDLLAELKALRKRLEFEDGFNQFGIPKAGGGEAVRATQIIESPAVKETKHPTGETRNENSIAVLPFMNMSADVENEYFCDGLAEELLNALAKIENLKVAARTSAFSFKGKNAEASQIGKLLNVNTILEGSVRKSGNRLRITVQLINAADGYHLWSERYNGELKDIFDLQDEITLAVIDELKVKLLSEERAALRNRYAENVEAYQLYLKGRYHSLKLTAAETEKGIEYFQQAIAIDPNYALAYAGLTAAYVTFPLSCDAPPAEFFPKAKAAAQKAIEIDDRLSETYFALFWATFWCDWDWDECERLCLRAIELSPNNADAHESYAYLLSNVGRHTEALAEIKIARELDPLDLLINALEGQFLLHAGRVEEALARLQKTTELEPRFWLAHLFAANVYIEKGMFAEAIEATQKARQFSGRNTYLIACGGYALAKTGEEARARVVLEELLKSSTERYVPGPNIALIYHGLGERDNALLWLERGLAERDARMAFLKVEPKWNNLRSDPRFQDLLRRVGLTN